MGVDNTDCKGGEWNGMWGFMGNRKITIETMIPLQQKTSTFAEEIQKSWTHWLLLSPISSQSKEAKYKGKGHIDLV